jgi:glycerate-2-kinase
MEYPPHSRVPYLISQPDESPRLPSSLGAPRATGPTLTNVNDYRAILVI